jgi:hypothetical protein
MDCPERDGLMSDAPSIVVAPTPIVVHFQQLLFSQHLKHPLEHRRMRFRVDPTPRRRFASRFRATDSVAGS